MIYTRTEVSAQELEFIFDFVEEASFTSETARNQLRSLWTAFCLHHDLNVDTSSYDIILIKIWSQLGLTDRVFSWRNFDGFSSFLSADLV